MNGEEVMVVGLAALKSADPGHGHTDQILGDGE